MKKRIYELKKNLNISTKEKPKKPKKKPKKKITKKIE